MELGIPFCRLTMGDTWRRNSDGTFSLAHDNEPNRQWMPILERRKQFSFSEDFAVAVTHSFPHPNYTGLKCILLVRDGRDTLYSQYKREQHQESLINFLASRVRPLDAFSHPCTWALLYGAWKTYAPDVLIVSFEGLKRKPLETSRKILEYLCVRRSEADMCRALEESSFEKARTSEQRYLVTEKKPRFAQGLRKGKAGEWRDIYGERELRFFKGFPNEMLRSFGYEAPMTAPSVTRYSYPNFLVRMIFRELYGFDASTMSAWHPLVVFLSRMLQETDLSLLQKFSLLWRLGIIECKRSFVASRLHPFYRIIKKRFTAFRA